MKFPHLLIFSILAATALLPSLLAEKSSEPTESFVARGNEPFWSLEIGDEKIEFQRLGAEEMESAELPLSEPLKTDQATVYVTTLADRPVTIVITQAVTADSMSGMQFPFEVVMLLPGEILRGVGGNPADLLMGAWNVSSLGEVSVPDDTPVTLQFDTEGRVSGNASCNRYGGGFKLTGEGLSFEPLVATRMACEEAKMDQEAHFFALMETVTRFEINVAGELTLLANDEPVIVAERAGD